MLCIKSKAKIYEYTDMLCIKSTSKKIKSKKIRCIKILQLTNAIINRYFYKREQHDTCWFLYLALIIRANVINTMLVIAPPYHVLRGRVLTVLHVSLVLFYRCLNI